MVATTPSDERLLLPLAVLDGQALDEDLARILGTVHVELVGYHEVPEQTAPSQMRQQFESRAEQVLDEVATRIVEAGGTVNSRLVFTHDCQASLDRIRDETDATAELLANPTGPVESMLIPVSGDIDPERIASFIHALRGEQPIDVTLLVLSSSASDGAGSGTAESIAELLTERGVAAGSITTDVADGTSPTEAIVDAAIDHEVTVMAERLPDWRSIIFGNLESRIARESLGPVFVVYRPPEAAEPE